MRSLAGIPLVLFASCAALAQQAGSAPALEVASVKPSAAQSDGHVRVSMGGDPGRVNYTNVTLKNVLARAYDVRSYQITGPSWLDSERYDVIAKVPDGAPKEQIPAMLQNLLAERFGMKVRRETKEQAVYALVVGKNGPKLKKAAEGEAARPPAAVAHSGGPARRGTMMMMSNGRLEARGATMTAFTDMLSNLMDRPVVDMTHIEGNYDIALDVSMEELAGMRKMPMMAGPGPGARGPEEVRPVPESGPAPSIFTAVQQLGLKLESRKAPIDYVVVEQAQKVPTEN
jgi:uncharacterized protein (TIGR03435 family)